MHSDANRQWDAKTFMNRHTIPLQLIHCHPNVQSTTGYALFLNCALVGTLKSNPDLFVRAPESFYDTGYGLYHHLGYVAFGN